MEFDISVAIRCPPEAVFALLADIQRYTGQPGSPVPEMEKLPPGPTGVGTRWREVVRLLPGVTMTMWSEVTAIEPGRRLEETFRGPWMTGTLAYSIQPQNGGAVLRQRETLEPHGPLRVVAGRMERMLRPRVVDRLGVIRDVLEREAETARC
jgi:uncharacterized protein YndB with AHSA1/START domain